MCDSPHLILNRQVSEKKAKQWCGAKGGIPHFDTSAKARGRVVVAVVTSPGCHLDTVYAVPLLPSHVPTS